PDDYLAATWKKKVDSALQYSKGSSEVALRYVGSAGVRLDGAGTAVFIDALYQSGLFHTAHPAIDYKSIVKADVLLFTHAHRDHFDPWITADVMKKTSAKVVGPPSVIALLVKHGVAMDRLVSVKPEKDKPVSTIVGKVKIQAHAVPHAGKFVEKGKPEHVAFILDLGGTKIIHFGSAGETKGMDQDGAKSADLVFLPHTMLCVKNEEWFKETAVRYLIPTRFMDSQGSFGSLQNLRDRYKKTVPLLPGQELTFN
ncbi:MAG: MBL fold metallo-hydrolase, partial [Planctomycetota bacterium]